MPIDELLQVLVEQTGAKMSPLRARFYLEALGRHPEDQVRRALTRLIMSAKSFPTIAEIESAMGLGEGEDKAEATAIARRIWAELSRGVQKDTPTRVSSTINQVVHVLGGWHALSDQTSCDHIEATIAQWRDTAVALLPKIRAGRLMSPALAAGGLNPQALLPNVIDIGSSEKDMTRN